MSAGHSDRIGNYWGVPDLAVGILSPGTEHKDREIKRMEYGKAGISEYWIVDPDARTVQVFRLNEGTGQYIAASLLGVSSELTSMLFPGFSLSVSDLFAEAS